MKLRRIVSLIAVAALAAGLSSDGPAWAEGLPDGFGVNMPTRSKVTTNLSFAADVDDYVFEGYPGQKFTGTLKVSKQSAVAAGLILLRPDGTEVTIADGAKVKTANPVTVVEQQQDPLTGDIIDVNVQVSPVTKVQFTLDQTGTWKLRCDILNDFVPDQDSGEYTVSTKYSKLGKVKDSGAQADANDQLRYTVPASGGATLKFKLASKGANITFNGLFDPSGVLIDGVVENVNTKPGKKITGKNIVLPVTGSQGNYEFVFDVPGGIALQKSKFTASAKLAKSSAKRTGRLDKDEPIIGKDEKDRGINPTQGGPGTLVTLTVVNAFDEFDSNGVPVVFLGGLPLDDINITDQGATTLISGTVSAALPEGAFAVTAETSTGQVDVLQNAFERVPPPVVFDIDPRVGSESGGYQMTITGENFRAPVDGANQMGLLIDGAPVPVNFISQTETEVVFIAQARPAGLVQFGVRDTLTQLRDNLPLNSFEYLSAPGVGRITPKLMSVLGGDDIFVKGTNFEATDQVFMETATPGVFEEITLTQATFKNSTLHSITAPVRPKGTYEIYLVDDTLVRTSGTHTIDYFTFADFSSDLGLSVASGELYDGWSTALADFDNDDDLDLFIAKKGGASRETDSQVTLLENDGSGGFTDVTSLRVSQVSATDDWRGDSIAVADMNQDGWADITVATASTSVPGSSASHVRILVSERRNSTADVSDRVFRDKTSSLMAPPRPGSGSGDNWRALDMWVGDIDLGPTGPPEIVITGTTVFEEIDITCGNYCSSNVGGALYRFYWSASRQFIWDQTKRSGQGQFKFDPNFFPRKSGVLVPIGNPPPGVTIPSCNGGTPCRGTFTPFSGQKLEVADMNADGKPDVVVINKDVVTKDGVAISSTQVAINKFSPASGSALTDVTHLITAMGGTTRWDTVKIGRFGYPDANAFGTIVLTKSSGSLNPSMRLIRFVQPLDPDDTAEFEEITFQVLPFSGINDKFQASDIGVVDVDGDGDRDLILLANSAPGPGESAFRILRNNVVSNVVGVFQEDFDGLYDPLVAPANDAFDGSSLLIGDLDNDGASEFVITRAAAAGTDAQTRAITIDK